MTEQCIKITCKICNTIYEIPDIDIEKNYCCKNCNKLIPIHPVTDLLESLGKSSYLNFIQQNMKVNSYSYMRETIEDLIIQLPYHINECIDRFIDGLYFMYNHHNYFWNKMTCKEALNTILKIAVETLPFNGTITSIKEMKNTEYQTMAFLLFKIASLNFAYIEFITRENSRNKILNKIIPGCNIGIKKKYHN